MNNLNARRAFLETFDIRVLDPATAREASRTPIFQEVFKRLKGPHGRGDAALLAFSKALDVPFATIEKGIVGVATKSLPTRLRPPPPIKVPSVRL